MGDTVFRGLHHADGTFDGDSSSGAIIFPTGSPSYDNPTDHSTVILFDIEIGNKGLSNQTVTFKYALRTINILGDSDTSKTNIENLMNTASYTTVGTLDFHAGGVPYALPDCFFLYASPGSIRLRVFGLDVIRMS